MKKKAESLLLMISISYREGVDVFFAIDNSDMVGDSPDGKHTMYSTAMAIYQMTEPHQTTNSRSSSLVAK